ncbi:hypothetical protein OG607_01820 [Streptomyces sp. NBC_01537]|uniref:hypothetical protein n=1 Tax=Streptomyces sp. NBC_01537 TaxID=2903896 RepID=UPI003867D7B6
MSAAPRRAVAPPPSRPEQLRALAEVLDEIAAAQPLSDQVVAACGDPGPGPVPDSVARQGGRQAVLCARLGRRLRELTLCGDLAEARERASRLLDYQHWMVQQSLNLAFTSNPTTRTEAARLHLNGLGAPADELRELRDRIRAQAGGTEPRSGNGQQTGTPQP